jgi:hypothetical protein
MEQPIIQFLSIRNYAFHEPLATTEMAHDVLWQKLVHHTQEF